MPASIRRLLGAAKFLNAGCEMTPPRFLGKAAAFNIQYSF
jgi:hypothetical protein